MSFGRRLRREAGRKIATGKIDLRGAHSDGRYVMSEHQFSKFINQLGAEQQDYVLENPLPKSYQDVRKVSVLGGTRPQDKSLDSNLSWYFKTIQPFASKIKDFILLKHKYEKEMLLGRYNDALATIQCVNTNICHSQWAMCQEILTNEYSGGLKSNKEVTSEFQSDSIDGVVSSLAYFQSLRSEASLPLYRLTEIVESSLSELSNFDKEYYLYKLFPSNENKTNWGLIMKVDSNLSVLDRYLTFVDVCLSVCCIGSENSMFGRVKQWVERMYHLTGDSVLYNLLLIHNSCETVSLNSESTLSYNINDHFYKGEYDKVVHLGHTILLAHPQLIEIHQMYVLANLYTGEAFNNPFPLDSPSYNILKDIYNILSKNLDVDISLSNALKTCYTLKGTTFGWELFDLFCKHHSIEGGDLNVRKASIACGVKANPEAISYSMNINLIKKHPSYQSSIILSIYTNYIANVNEKTDYLPNSVDQFQKRLLTVDILIYKKEFDRVLQEIDFLLTDDKYHYQRSIKFNMDYLIHAKMIIWLSMREFGKAIQLVASTNLLNYNFHSRLGNRHLISAALSEDNDEVAYSIFTPILLNQYATRYKVSTNDIWIAYDNFMLGMGVERPSQLRMQLANLDRDALIYFLKNVSVQEILGKSYNHFETEDDLDNERMAVLGLLCEVDSTNFEIYVRELQHLSSSIEIRKGIKQINESKIYVDVSGIQSFIDKELRETFNRAVELDALNLPDVDSFIEIFGDNFSVLNIKEINNKKQFVSTSAQDVKQQSDLLRDNYKRLFLRIRDVFISNSDFGIDSYLSMRIRHGALTNHIRSIFESNFFVTKIDPDKDEYIRNNYWLSKMDITDATQGEMIDSIFSEFSKEVDNHATYLKNVIVQLSTEQRKTNGVFNYAYSESDLNELHNKLFKRMRSYDDFFLAAIEELWRRTEMNLSRVREVSLPESQQKIIASLEKLNLNISKHSYINDIVDFSRTVTECKTQFRQEMEKISSWFKRSTSTIINDFSIDLPIKTSLSVVRKIHIGYSNFDPSRTINSSMVFGGKYFIHFSDIFRNLFDNILTHSQVPEEELSVALIIFEKANRITISLANNFSRDKSLEIINLKIDNVTAVLDGPIDEERTRGEGGTGYPKIQKILRSDLGCRDFKIEIDPVNESRIFTARLSFDTNQLRP